MILKTFKVSLDCQACLLEPVWYCVEMLALVLEQNSHSSAVPIISLGVMSHTAVGFGQRGEAVKCCAEETNRSRLKSVAGRKESIGKSIRTAPACTQRLQLEAVFCKFSNQRARVTARLCCQ